MLDEEGVDDAETGYTITKELIIEAWSKYRPSPSAENTNTLLTPMVKAKSTRHKNTNRGKDPRQIYGEVFINKLLRGIKLRSYSQKNSKKDKDDVPKPLKNEFVENFTYKLKQ